MSGRPFRLSLLRLINSPSDREATPPTRFQFAKLNVILTCAVGFRVVFFFSFSRPAAREHMNRRHADAALSLY